ncbi:metalloregulator ArsR/SmtB family transcription factor [Bradyrhizobium sp.]|uniref:ArsR/SmtB family transcription factor n=1 Tax=Bradyrhizobium sp. TaxID=376 RepID=UPI002623FF10|nr:metalloregulator ArsR/SmtB family transcription factor [Bradyrhizobium sp.]
MADALAALGNRTRLRIFKLLVKAGPDGANIGSLQERLGIPATTLAHHVASLTKAGLLEQERRGREVICTANFRMVNDVLTYVKSECCAGLK